VCAHRNEVGIALDGRADDRFRDSVCTASVDAHGRWFPVRSALRNDATEIVVRRIEALGKIVALIFRDLPDRSAKILCELLDAQQKNVSPGPPRQRDRGGQHRLGRRRSVERYEDALEQSVANLLRGGFSRSNQQHGDGRGSYDAVRNAA
jgi:hypothetical protein